MIQGHGDMAFECPRGLWLTQGHEREERVPWSGHTVGGEVGIAATLV